MARIAAALAATLALGACDNGKHHLHPEAGAFMDAPPPPWWQPELGTVKDWDIQLAAPFDVSATHVMYDLPLFDLVPAATMVDYGDGAPVTFPAGALAGKLADLHGRGVIVICHVDTGAIRLTDPDAMKFPGYEASPPTDPTPPKAGSVIGWSVDGMGGDERLLDVREASRPLWTAKMFKRLDLAKTIGCDGVDAAFNNVGEYMSGFAVTGPENITWYTEVATELHSRKLSAGMRNGQNISGEVDTEASKYDWMLLERCGEHQDCDMSRPFLNLHRSVFALDYQSTEDQQPQAPEIVCAKQTAQNISEGLQKDDAITSAFRHVCDP